MFGVHAQMSFFTCLNILQLFGNLLRMARDNRRSQGRPGQATGDQRTRKLPFEGHCKSPDYRQTLSSATLKGDAKTAIWYLLISLGNPKRNLTHPWSLPRGLVSPWAIHKALGPGALTPSRRPEGLLAGPEAV